MSRPDGRSADQLREIKITRGWLEHAEGSVLIEFGATRVLCAARATEEVLLLGVRTPVIEGKPLILRVRLKKADGPWHLSNFEMLPPVALAIKDDRGEQGIRTIGFDPSRGVWLIVTGNATSVSKAPFALYAWDGNAQGAVRHYEQVRFHNRMRVEGVTHACVGGRGAIVFVDDRGGYQVLWDDDPRLK